MQNLLLPCGKSKYLTRLGRGKNELKQGSPSRELDELCFKNKEQQKEHI